MPVITGNSQLGGQLIFGYASLTIPEFELLIGTQPNIQPSRVGWGYVMLKDAAPSSSIRMLQQGPIIRPGTYYAFTNRYGFSGVTYGLIINWNLAGLSYRLSYS